MKAMKYLFIGFSLISGLQAAEKLNCSEQIKKVCQDLGPKECIKKRAAKLKPKCFQSLAREAYYDKAANKCFEIIEKTCKDKPTSSCMESGIKSGVIPQDCAQKMQPKAAMNGVSQKSLMDCVQEMNKVCPIDYDQLSKDGLKKYQAFRQGCFDKKKKNLSKTCRQLVSPDKKELKKKYQKIRK